MDSPWDEASIRLHRADDGQAFDLREAQERAGKGRHLGLWSMRERVEQLGGAFADDPPMGTLLFKAETPQTAEDFARADPYVRNGVFSDWRVREWVTVVGAAALTKV